MGFTGVSINRLNGGLGRRNPAQDGVCLLVIGGAVAATGLALKVAAELLSIDDAEALGITAAYDDTNDILAHHHIDEFFRVSPDGNLFVILDDNTLTNAEVKTILKDHPEIKLVGYVRNAALAPVDFDAYVSGYQTMVDELEAENRIVSSVLVEGVEFSDATLISAYADLRAIGARKVSVVISQDPIIRAVKAAHETYASIGTALGAISARRVNENLGSVDIENKPAAFKGTRDYPLTDKARQRWLSAVLQSGVDFNSLSNNDITALNDAGYIFVGFYNGYAGYFFNDSHTCEEAASDYSRIENNRVWDKAAGIIRTTLLPRVKSNLPKDPDTGFIRVIAAKEMEALAKKELDAVMEAPGEISGSSVYIDPQQELNNDQALTVKAEIVLNNIIHEIEVDLGLTLKLS